MPNAAENLEETRLQLLARWQTAREEWQDMVAERFGEEYVLPFLEVLHSTGEAAATALEEIAQAAIAVEDLGNRP